VRVVAGFLATVEAHSAARKSINNSIATALQQALTAGSENLTFEIVKV
jgi:hypothetical protein